MYVRVVYRSANSSIANNAQLCNLISYNESTANRDLLILGDFNYAAIDWNAMYVPFNLFNESLFLEKLKDLLLEQIDTVPLDIESTKIQIFWI